MTELRPYQSDVITELREVIASGKRRIILVAPTGSGKTVIAAALIKAAIGEGTADHGVRNNYAKSADKIRTEDTAGQS